MNRVQVSVQRLVRNVLLLQDVAEMDLVSQTMLCDTLDCLNEYMEALNSKDSKTVSDYQERRKEIFDSIVLFQVLKMVYDPERLGITPLIKK